MSIHRFFSSSFLSVPRNCPKGAPRAPTDTATAGRKDKKCLRNSESCLCRVPVHRRPNTVKGVFALLDTPPNTTSLVCCCFPRSLEPVRPCRLSFLISLPCSCGKLSAAVAAPSLATMPAYQRCSGNGPSPTRRGSPIVRLFLFCLTRLWLLPFRFDRMKNVLCIF